MKAAKWPRRKKIKRTSKIWQIQVRLIAVHKQNVSKYVILKELVSLFGHIINILLSSSLYRRILTSVVSTDRAQ